MRRFAAIKNLCLPAFLMAFQAVGQTTFSGRATDSGQSIFASGNGCAAPNFCAVTMLVDLVAGTVNAITSAIPSCQNTAAAGNLAVKPSYQMSSFVSDYNRILLTPTGNLAVDAASPNLVLHRHSKFMRLSTMGLLH